MKDKVLKKLVNYVALETMEGRMIWSSIDILDIKAEIKDKEDLLHGLKLAEAQLRKSIEREVEFLALKGYESERIIKKLARKQSRLAELDRRTSFIGKTRNRLKKRVKSFKTEMSRGWYIKFEDTQSYQNHKYILAIRRHEARTKVPVFFTGIGPDGSIPQLTLSSDELPILYTLGILLKKRERVVKTSSKKYIIQTRGLL